MSDTTSQDLFAQAFGTDVKTVRTSEVIIPDDIRAKFARAVTAFASAPNTIRVPEDMGTADAAATYVKQIRQYARETNRTALADITGTVVTWRFCKVTPSVRGRKRGSK